MTEYQYITPSSPWWPLMVSNVLASGRAPGGSYPPQLEHWMTWHFHFLLRGAGFVPMWDAAA